MQVAQLKDELETTHTHYQKLLESTGAGGWGRDPGPVERAAGGLGAGAQAWIIPMGGQGYVPRLGQQHV